MCKYFKMLCLLHHHRLSLSLSQCNRKWILHSSDDDVPYWKSRMVSLFTKCTFQVMRNRISVRGIAAVAVYANKGRLINVI